VLECRSCQQFHTVDWTIGWQERMDSFVDEHYAEHGEFRFVFRQH